MFLVILKPCRGQQPSIFLSNQSQLTDEQELRNEKLRQEILKLQLENEKLKNFWGVLPSYGTFLTALVAVTGVIVTIWKHIRQREKDSLRRLDERFTSTVANLGSEKPSIQASAAVSIITFLRPEYDVFRNQVFMILLANLKVRHSDAVNKLLIEGFEKAVRMQLQVVKKKGEHFELDLSSCNLYRVDLSGLDLSYADLGFAKLRGANLSDADLYRVRGWKANLENAKLSRANLEEARLRKAQFKDAQFHKARLVSVDLKEARLARAQFYQAQMQSAHLDKANLNGARFEQADLNDTHFHGASLNEQTLKSILKAFNWQKAHFDDDVRAKLEVLAEGHS